MQAAEVPAELCQPAKAYIGLKMSKNENWIWLMLRAVWITIDHWNKQGKDKGTMSEWAQHLPSASQGCTEIEAQVLQLILVPAEKLGQHSKSWVGARPSQRSGLFWESAVSVP